MSEEDGGGSSIKRGGRVRRLVGIMKKEKVKDTSRRSLPIAMPHKLIPIDNDEHYKNVNARLQQSIPTFQPVVYRHDNDNNSVIFDDNMTTAATASSSCYYRPSCYYSHDPCAAGSKLLAILFSCGL